MILPNISKFIKQYVTKRDKSFFDNDLINNKERLTKEIRGKSILVIGGAGTIGSSFIKAALNYSPSELIVVDNNENGLIVPPRDPILLAESIDAILSNDVFQNKIIQNSQKLVKNRTLKITHDKYIQVVHDALVKN